MRETVGGRKGEWGGKVHSRPGTGPSSTPVEVCASVCVVQLSFPSPTPRFSPLLHRPTVPSTSVPAPVPLLKNKDECMKLSKDSSCHFF